MTAFLCGCNVDSSKFANSIIPGIVQPAPVAENIDSNALGRYVVVGKQVTLWAAVQVNMSSTSITFDNFGIKGLPFSTANITNYRAVGCFAYSNSNVSDEDTAITITMGPNQNHMHVQILTTSTNLIVGHT